MNVKTFPEVIQYLEKKKRPHHLLLGNGFSMAYDDDIFSYNALYTFIQTLDDELLTKLFNVVKSKNFELIMQQLDNFLELIETFDPESALNPMVTSASQRLKESLINAIETLHPEHVFKMPEEKAEVCSAFFNHFLQKNGQIFTTNYDLLLYWVLMRKGVNSIDGFGRDKEKAEKGEPVSFSDLRWGRNKDEQNIHYLHGALHLFDTGIEVIKEEYDSKNFIMEKVKGRIEMKQYPVFVTAGSSEEKLEHIMHNHYLSYCFDQLSSIGGSLIVFGFGFGDYDGHIIEAINRASRQTIGKKLWSIYIGVNSDRGLKHIESISSRFECKVNIFDAKTAPVWEEKFERIDS